MPPMAIHWFDEAGFNPHVFGMKGARDPKTFKRVFVEDPEQEVRAAALRRGFRLQAVLAHPHRHPPAWHSRVRARTRTLFLLGTDVQGRDVYSRLLFATQISMSIGLVGVTLSLLLGVMLGGISGFFGGIVDTVIQRIIEILRSIPTIPLWMALTAALPRDWSVVQIYFAITIILSIFGWTELARVVRGRFLALREEDFVTAALLSGASRPRIILRHMVPSFFSHIIAASTLAIPEMIIAETALSFLGLGLQPPAVSYGVMLQAAQNVQTIATTPWLMVPALPVIILVLSFNFLGDGLRDAADPYSQVAALDGRPRRFSKCATSKTVFRLDEGMINAVDDVSFDVAPGKTLGVVGESGCGKSVTARSILGILDARGEIAAARSIYLGRARTASEPLDLAALDPNGEAMRAIRGDEIALVFQEPMSSFSPVHTVGSQLIEAIRLHRDVSRDGGAPHRHRDSCGKVGIPHPEQRIDAYAFQLSGGLRQRAMIAIAISCDPNLLIADEPTTALDVTTQAQILDLLREMQRLNGMAIMLITHDLGVDRRDGRRCRGDVPRPGRRERAGRRHLPRAGAPLHQGAAASIPSVDAGQPGGRLATISGSVPHPSRRPPAARSTRAARPSCPASATSGEPTPIIA